MANETVTVTQNTNSVTVNQSLNSVSTVSTNPAAGLGSGGQVQGSLDITQNLDVDGTLETDALTIDGVSLLETIQDAVGGMVTGNTETGITVNYQDSDGTLDFAVSSVTDENFTTADHEKLDGIELLADVTDTENVVSSLTAGTNISIAADGTISSADTQVTTEQIQDAVGSMLSGNTESGITVTYDDVDNEIDFTVTSQTDNNFTTALKDKLDGIEALADVTDTANVVASLTAGTNVSISALGVVSSTDTNTTYSVGDGGLTQNNFTTALKDKLDAVEALADVTDTANVVAALTAGTNVSISSLGVVSSTDTNTTYGVGDGGLTQNNFTTALKEKLDAIEALADVTPSWVPNSDPTYATQTYVGTQVANLVDSAPDTLDTLDELAAALGDDPSFATTIATSIGTKLSKSGGLMTGNIAMSGSETVDGRDLSVDGDKLDNIEALADVTDTANVVASLTAGTNVSISSLGVVSSTDTNTTYGVGDGGLTQNNFTTALKDKLVAIEASADVTDTANVVASLTAGTNVSISALGVVSSTDTNTTYGVGDGGLTQNNFTTALKDKLVAIEASADVTDTANVVASLTAGTNVSISSLGVVSSTDTNTTYGVGDNGLTQNNFTNTLKDKLDNIEALADVTDTANVVASLTAGTNVSISALGVVSSTDTNTTYGVGDGGLTQNNFTTALKDKLDGVEALADVTDTVNVVASLTAGTNVSISALGVVSSTDTNTTYGVGDNGLTQNNFTDALKNKLDGVEALADVTDTANVVASLTAGNNIGIAADGTITATDTNTTYAVGDGGLTQNNFTNTLKSKLTGIEDSADVTDTANVVAALTAGTNVSISAVGVVSSTDTNTTYGVGDGGLTQNNFTNTLKDKLDAIEASADVTDTANVVNALTAGTNVSISNLGVVSSTDTNTTYGIGDGGLTQKNFTTALKDKLDAIEASADVTDTANVVASLTAGTNVSISALGVVSSTDTNTTYGVGDGGLTQNNFTTALKDKLVAIEASADVTDTANVVSALTAGTNVNIAADGTVSSTDTNTTYSVGDGGLTQNNFTTALKDKLDAIEASADVTDTANVVASLTAGTNVSISALGVVSSTDTNTTYGVGDGGLTQNNFTTALKNKLDAIEASADVTDTANVVASLTAGTNVSISALGVVSSTDTNTTYSVGDGGLTQNNFTTALKDKLVAIEALADVTPAWVPSADPTYATQAYVGTQVANLVASAPDDLNTLNELAEALGDDDNFATTVNSNIATKLPLAGGTMTGNIAMSGSETVDGRDLSVDGAKLDNIEVNADVTDTANVVAALSAGTNVSISALGVVSSTDTNTTYSVGDGGLTQNNFTTALKDKLVAIEASADVTDTANVVAALSAGTNVSISALGVVSSTDTNTTYSVGDGGLTQKNFTTALFGKLNGVEATADVTDTVNVVAALTAGTNVNIAADGTISSTDTNTTYSVGDGGLTQKNFTTTLKSKLEGIEDSADVTDTTNVVAALTAGTNVSISALGVVSSTDTNTTYAVGDGGLTQKNFTTALKNKLDAIEALADVTDTANVVGALSAGSNITISGAGLISATDTNTTYSVGDGGLTQNNFTTALKDKLVAIEASADVTDTTNVVAALTAGTNVNIAVDGTISATDTNTTYSVGNGGLTQNNFTTALKDKLDAVEASADVTDTTNVVAALTAGTNVNIAADGTISSTDTNTTYAVGNGGLTQNNFTDALKSKLDSVEGSADVTDTTNVVAALTAGTNVSISNLGVVSSTDTNTTYGVGDGGLTQNNFTDALKTKLVGVEASADVTDTANVVAALTAGTNVNISTDGTISSTDTNTTYSVGDGGLTQKNFTTALNSKLGGIEASADVTDTANVVAALTAGTNVNISTDGTISSTDTNTTYSVGDGGLTQKNFTTTLKSKLDNIEAGATADQTAAEILTLIKTVDGSGSGLDADTLDGISSGAFLRSNAADTASGLLTLNGGLTVLSGTGGGQLRIKRNSSSSDGDDITDIHMDDSGIFFDIDNDNDNDSGIFSFRYKTGGSFSELFKITPSAITVAGTVDGRDIAADGSKLDGIEAGADVTDTTNVVAALTAGTNVNIAANGTISSTDTNTTYSVGDGGLTQKNFTTALNTKLSGIEASADVTDTTNVVAALTAGTNVNIAANGTISSTDTNTTYSVGDGGLTQKNFTTALKTKLDGISTGADVTPSWVPSGDPSYATQSYVGTQISNLVASAPSTLDTLNELAYALGDDANFSTTVTNSIATKAPLASPSFTGDVVITDDTLPFIRSSTNSAGAGIKFSDNAYGGSYGQQGTLTFRHTDSQSYGSGASFEFATTESTCTILGGKLMYGEGIYSKPATGTGAGTRKDSNWDTAYGWGDHASVGYVTTNTTYAVGDGGLTQNNFTDADHTKLNGIEASADVTDTANVVAALTAGTNVNIAANGTISSTDTNTTYSVGDGGLTQKNFTTALNTKLSGIEASADVTDTANVVAALTAGSNVSISALGVVSSTDTNTTYSVGDGGLTQKNFTTALNTKLSGIEASADVTDTTNVVAALTAGTNVNIAANGTISSTDTNTTYSVGDGGLTQKNFTTTLKSKLDGIAASANNYSLPAATSATRGGVKIGYTQSGKNYPVVLDSEKMYVNVPWVDTDTNTTYSVGDGGLTQKNFTTTLKTKLDGIATSANNYSLPAATSSTRGGVKIGYTQSGKNYPVVLDAEKMYVNVPWSDSNTTYSVGDGGLTQKNFTTTLKSKLDGIEANATADQTAAEIRTLVGSATDSNVFTDADHTKLNGVATSANNYSLPAGSSSTRGGFKIGYTQSGKNYPVVVSSEQMYVNVPWSDSNTTYSVGDGGLTQKNFTTTLKSKLDGISAGADVTPSWVPSSNPNYLTSSNIAAPAAPTSVAATVVGETVDVTFNASSTSNIDSYLVYSSVDGSDYGLISIVPPDDFSSTMSVIDNSFTETGTQAYRVYAMKLGNMSSAGTASVSYSVSSLEPTNLSVVNLHCAYHVQWDAPSSNSRFVSVYNVYKHEHATQGSLSRSSASLVYSGTNTNFMYQISGSNNNNFHQFWVETTIA